MRSESEGILHEQGNKSLVRILEQDGKGVPRIPENVVVLSFDLIVDGETEYEVLLGLDHGRLKMAELVVPVHRGI